MRKTKPEEPTTPEETVPMIVTTTGERIPLADFDKWQRAEDAKGTDSE